MKLKFAANLSWLFKEETNIVARYQAASRAGFKAVESADLYNIPLDELTAAKNESGVEHVLMNGWPGETSKGELGISAIPGKESLFKESLATSIAYCNALGCKRLHIMAGRSTREHSLESMKKVYISNLKYAAESLSQHGITALIEPVNSKLSAPGYYMDTVDKAIDIIREVNHPGLKLQMDLYHMQIMHGYLTSVIKTNLPYIGHMQIAQVPDRHEPDSAGEINYSYVFNLLEELEYDGYIGLEYIPAGGTVEGLYWFRKYIEEQGETTQN